MVETSRAGSAFLSLQVVLQSSLGFASLRDWLFDSLPQSCGAVAVLLLEDESRTLGFGCVQEASQETCTHLISATGPDHYQQWIWCFFASFVPQVHGWAEQEHAVDLKG